MKICNRCYTEKNLSEFGRDKSTKDGLARICKMCNVDKSKAYYKENKEKRSDYDASRYKSKKEEIKKRVRTYSIENKDDIRKRRKEYYYKNQDEIKLKSAVWRGINQTPERRRDYQNNHIKKMPDYYIKNLIKSQTGLADPTIAMIEAKRAILKAKRIIKEHESNDHKD